MNGRRPTEECPASVKAELVMRLLGGCSLTALVQETGRPRKQLVAWRQRFVEGGEASFDSERKLGDLEASKAAQRALTARLEELEAKSTLLARQLALVSPPTGRAHSPHPYCTDDYASACAGAGLEVLAVPAWGAHVLVREGRGGTRHATGVRPLQALDPGIDLSEGLEALRRGEIASMALATDPMWSPPLATLQAAFTNCRTLRRHYLVDREATVHRSKRHRNRINQACRAGKTQEVSLAEHLGRWMELYDTNATTRRIPQPFTRAYFAHLAQVSGLRTIAMIAGGEIVNMTLWLEHHDTLYYHDGASSETGKTLSAAYAGFAHAIEGLVGCRYVLLGGAAGASNHHNDGLTMFKRGFSNATVASYLCNAGLAGT
jgi:transposase-like protein